MFRTILPINAALLYCFVLSINDDELVLLINYNTIAHIKPQIEQFCSFYKSVHHLKACTHVHNVFMLERLNGVRKVVSSHKAVYGNFNSIKMSTERRCFFSNFYSPSALLAMQSAVLARAILSVSLSVRLFVRHVPAFRRMKI